MKIGNLIIKAMENALHAAVAVAVILSLPTLVSCSSDDNEITAPQHSGATLTVRLTIQTRSDVEGYSEGSTYENYIDIEGGNYRIYFFTNDKDDANATSESDKNTLIAEFNPTDVTVVEGTDYTEYEVTGDILETIANYSSFKVVVLANWAYESTTTSSTTYPTVTAGETTIDALCENDDATYYASRFLTTYGVDANHLVPFFGVNEYENVKWETNTFTDLSGADIKLLRALAKVEVRRDDSLGEFSSVTINGYNTRGYCAPKNVYSRGDYFHDYTWSKDFTSSLHLYGDKNSTVTGLTQSFNEVDDKTRVIYLPEYDNSGSDYAYITVKLSGSDESKTIYFGNYTDGVCTAYGEGGNTEDRYDICRNYCYRFTLYDMNSTISAQGAKGKGVKSHSQPAVIGTKIERNEH